MSDRALTVHDLCERYGVSEHTVLGWIRSGELKAINVSRKPSGRPRWRVSSEALMAFEALRTPTPPMPRKRRKKQPIGVIEFYK